MSSSPWLVVLAGGAGTRFWPRSRALRPKQFLPIAGEEPLLQLTLKRFAGWISTNRMVVATSEALEQETIRLVSSFAGVSVIAEPVSRNTGPSVAFAMEWIRKRDPSATVVVVPADHWITEEQEYIQVMKRAVAAVEKLDCLCTIGIPPTRAETGYGYIRCGSSLDSDLYRVDRFVEKPKKEVAETMVQSPEYLWNAGMFVWRLDSYFREAEIHSAEVLRCFVEYRASTEENEPSSLKQAFANVPAISIDYALMEKSQKVVVLSGASFGWNDLGSFLSLEEVYPKREGCVSRSPDVIALESFANIVDAPGKTVALLGVSGMIVVDTGDVLLVAAKERAQDVKLLVDKLRASGRKELL
jgi:mannose-1-phosphate guanylyltransferase